MFKTLFAVWTLALSLILCSGCDSIDKNASDDDTPPETSQAGAVSEDTPQDTEAPSWPEGAILSAEQVGAHELNLGWSAAIDDQVVSQYIISQGGVEIATISSGRTQYTAVGLVEGERYTFGVRAEDLAGNRSPVLEISASPADLQPPLWSESASIRATELTESSARLSWSEAQDQGGVAYYQIQLDDQIVGQTTEVSYQVEGLTAFTEYTAELIAVDQAGLRSGNNPTLRFTTTDNSPPVFAEGAALSITDQTSRQARLTWYAAIDNVGVTGYRILQDEAPIAELNATERSASELSYLVSTLIPGTRVTLAVQAIDSSGNISASGPSVTFDTGDDTAPTWPVDPSIRAIDLTPHEVTLAWSIATDDVGVSTYQIREGNTLMGESEQTTFTVGGLNPWTEYTFTVHARDAAGNATETFLSVTTQTLDSVAPSWEVSDQLSAQNITPTSMTLIWPAATDDVAVVTYRVFQDDQLIASLDRETTHLDLEGLSPWTLYAFQVKAVDAAENSSPMGLTLAQRTSDNEAPFWAEGTLVADQITPERLTLSWPLAQDDVGIEHYRVTQNGRDIALLDSMSLRTVVNDLTPWTDFTFEVTAIDAAGNTTEPLEVSLKTPDTIDPSWPDEAQLTISELEGRSLNVSWPTAVDDVSIMDYQVSVDGLNVATLDGELTQTKLEGLTPGMTIWVQVYARDPAGNQSSTLGVTVTLPDAGPPTWEDPRLNATAGITDVMLTWTVAEDDIGVIGYRIYQDGEQIADAVEQTLHIENLNPETEYTFTVEAGDAAGNWSSDGPEATVRTAKPYDPGFKRLSKEQYKRTVADLFSGLYQRYCERINGESLACSNPHPVFGGLYEWERWFEYNLLGPTWENTHPNDSRVKADGELKGGFSRLNSSVYSEHVSAWFDLAMYAAQQNFETWNDYTKVSTPCARDQRDGLTNFANNEEMYEACISNFIDEFGLRAFRRPVTEEEHLLLMEAYRSVEEIYSPDDLGGKPFFARGVRNVLATILLSPSFLYQVELGDEEGNLTPYELASRLSYHFWNTMPDDELLEAAANGSLMTEVGYTAQVERLFADPRAEFGLEDFYRDFFRVHELPELSRMQGPGEYGRMSNIYYHAGVPGSIGSTYFNPWGDGNRGNWSREVMTSELLNLGKWFTSQNPGTYEDMFRSNLHLLECHWRRDNPDVCLGAGVWSYWTYGVQGICEDYEDCSDQQWISTETGWDGDSEPINLPEPERAGLITRLSFLAHDTHNARPIQRGLKIRDMLLCDPLPPPENCDVVKPPNLTGSCFDPTLPEDDENQPVKPCSDDLHCDEGQTCQDWDREIRLTVREKVEELTEVPGTSCAGCHSTFINGFGHALGHFSAIGQYSDNERMFQDYKDAHGHFRYYLASEDNWVPIDDSGRTFYNGEWVDLNGARELSDFLVNTGQLEWCWSRQYFRFTMGRTEWDSDAQTIEDMAQSLRDGATLADAYKAAAYLPQFKSLYKPPRADQQGGTP